MIFLDEDTKITNVCLNHNNDFRSKGLTLSSIKLKSNGYVGMICTLTPTKVRPPVPQLFLWVLTTSYFRLNRPW